MLKKLSNTKFAKNRRAKKSGLLGSIFTHVILAAIMAVYLNPTPALKKPPEELKITLVKLVEIDSARQTKKSVSKRANKIDPVLDKVVRKRFAQKTPSVHKLEVAHLNNIQSPRRALAKARIEPEIKTAPHRPASAAKQIIISSVSESAYSVSINQALPVSNLSAKEPGVALTRNIKPAPVLKNIGESSNSDDELLAYQNAIKDLISSHKIYPWIARRKGIEGLVWVSFSILRNGQLKNIKLVSSSNSQILDQAAIKTINRASPFSPLPQKANKDELWMKVALSFSLE